VDSREGNLLSGQAGEGVRAMEDRMLYEVRDVAGLLSLSRSKVYELIRSGVLPSVRIDGCRRVRGSDLRVFVDEHCVAS